MNRLSLLPLLALAACATPAADLPAVAAEPPPAAPAAAPAVATVGQPAPGFSLPNLAGEPVSLGALRGKTVVLEWFNPDCPFVKYAHGEGPLKDQGDRVTKDGVVWLAINSGAPGKQGAGLDRNKVSKQEYGFTYPVLLDETGATGRAYGAKTTPHMYVIDPAGTLVYAGGLDNAPLGKAEGGAITNYVDAALADLAASRPVKTSASKPYGCGVKY